MAISLTSAQLLLQQAVNLKVSSCMEPINIENVRAISAKKTSSNKHAAVNLIKTLICLYFMAARVVETETSSRAGRHSESREERPPLKSRIESRESVKKSM